MNPCMWLQLGNEIESKRPASSCPNGQELIYNPAKPRRMSGYKASKFINGVSNSSLTCTVMLRLFLLSSTAKIQHALLRDDRTNASCELRNDSLERGRVRQGTFLPCHEMPHAMDPTSSESHFHLVKIDTAF